MSLGRHSPKPLKTRFYHASPRRFRHGDILTAGHEGGYAKAAYTEAPRFIGSSKKFTSEHVCMTDSPAPHSTIMRHAIKEDWLVYEVDPQGKVWFADMNNEFRAHSAIVLKCLGRAGGLAKRWRPGAYQFKDYDFENRTPDGKAKVIKKSRFMSYPKVTPRRGVKASRYLKARYR